MKKNFISLFFIIFSFPLFSLGYNLNFELDAGISECLFGSQIKENKYLWNDINNFDDYLSTGAGVTAEFILNQDISIITGLQFKHIQLNYLTIDGNEYGNDTVQLCYSLFQIPIMAEHNFIIKKTTEVTDSINVSAGINLSILFNKQTYKDSMTDYIGNFISKPFNIGVSLKTTYTHKIGPGKVFIGIKADMSLIPQEYSIGGRNVQFGNVISVSPLIGYKFILKEDKELAKITEKNKRIKDIDVK